jgi:N-acetylglucosamine-6-phosphate deacetylase
VTLAPGRAGAAAAVARLRRAGVAVALGHGRRTDELEACVSAGAQLVTHLFNAMGPLHHREPGLAGHALDDARLSCSLIPDGVHVHAAMLRNAYRCLGPERTILVTDSVAAAGMPDGNYQLAGATVRLQGGVVRDSEGHLAGSALTMADAARGWLRMVDEADACSLARVASTNPARIAGAASLGEIAPGRAAAFCVLAPDGELRSLR